MDRQLYRLLSGSLLGLAVICLLLGSLLQHFGHSPSATPVPTGSPSPPPPVDAAAACARLGPLLDASNSESVALISGAQAPPGIDLRTTIAGLRSAEPLAPAAWRPDIAVQYRTLQQLADARGDQARVMLVPYDEFAAAGSRLMHDCETVTAASATSAAHPLSHQADAYAVFLMRYRSAAERGRVQQEVPGDRRTAGRVRPGRRRGAAAGAAQRRCPAVTDGPYLEMKEYLASFYLLDCENEQGVRS
jgi:hypothetical protein